MFNRKLKLYSRFKEIALQLSKLGIYNIYEYFKVLFGIEVDPSLKPQKIRQTLEYLGPSFIKLGQILSIRPDLIPQSIIIELIKLQDKVQPIPFDQIKPIIENEINKPLEEVFDYIDPNPIGSASIAQVYYGVLKSGEKVAIKVKRPGLEELISLDAEIFLKIISFLEKHSKTVKDLDLKSVIYQYKYTTLREADFEIEASNIRTFRKNFENYDKGFYIPKYYPQYSTKNLLVLEFIEGYKLSQLDQLNISKKHLAEVITDAYYKMVFKDGFYHADPHPGNFIIKTDGTVVLLDYGMVGSISGEKRKLLYEHIFSVVNKNTQLAMNFYEGMGMITPKTDLDKLESFVEVFIEKYYNKNLSNINLKEMVLEIIDLVRECNLKLPTSLAYLGKSAIGLDGVIRNLDPSFNPTERLSKFLTKSIAEYTKEKFDEIIRIVDFYYNLAFKLDKIIKLLNIERLSIRILFKDLEELQNFYKNQVSKIALSIIFIGFLISSALFSIAGDFHTSEVLMYLSILTFIFLIYRLIRF
ncbi:ABC1 kinase family protein [Sulfurihydrogenibium subterraneum]|uniref:ABC1 kinase family protein n=1 Tax=Sulfurihydrogenibium subterraneum TaxID=171121 RepID=UPI00048EF5A3|nr:AarF/UbiB family protein [Sulfurihydrogenibium subterraneum]